MRRGREVSTGEMGGTGAWRTLLSSREAIAVETAKVWRDLRDCLKVMGKQHPSEKRN